MFKICFAAGMDSFTFICWLLSPVMFVVCGLCGFF